MNDQEIFKILDRNDYQLMLLVSETEEETLAHEAARAASAHCLWGLRHFKINHLKKAVIETLLKFRLSSDMLPSKTESAHSGVNKV